MKKLSLAAFGFLSASLVGGAVIWPEDFAIALVGLVIGLGVGITLSTTMMESYFQNGANMAYELQKKQVSDPAKIMRETRLAAAQAEGTKPKENTKSQPRPNVEIPKFNRTGIQN